MDMKRHDTPEFNALFDLLAILNKEPDNERVSEAADRLQQMINENAISVIQSAHLYVFTAREGILYPETLKTIRRLSQAMVEDVEEKTKQWTPPKK